MNKVYRWLILLLLMGAAIGCYAMGSIVGLGIFIILGLGFELGFWRGLLNNIKKPNLNEPESK